MPSKRVKSKSDIINALRSNSSVLASLKVKKLELFGSFARGTPSPKSDIDFIVEFAEPVGYFHFFDVRKFLEELLGREIDLVTKSSLRPELVEEVEKEAIRAA